MRVSAAKQRHRFGAAVLALGFLLGVSAEAQLLPEPRATKPPAAAAARMDVVLWEADMLWHGLREIFPPSAERVVEHVVSETLSSWGLDVSPAAEVAVEIVGPNQGVIDISDAALRLAVENEVDRVRQVLEAHGAVIGSTWMRRVSAVLPVGELVAVALALPEGYYLQRSIGPEPDSVAGEGPTVTNSAGYRDAGANGTGVTIGVIDASFGNFYAAVLNGDAPTAGQRTVIDYVGNFGSVTADRHGTACVETAYDHAPGARWRLYNIRNLTDLGSAVQDMIANATPPRLITHSLSWFNTGWADDSGPACAAALQAAQAGILFFTSAGNRADSHYQATFAAAPGNPIPGWHRFGPGDETNDITIPDGETVRFYLQWDNSDGVTDYDLYLYNDAITIELARSINVGATQFEVLSYTNNTGAPRLTHLGVRRMAGNAVEFELFETSSSSTWQYLTPTSSTTSPSNTNHRNVVSVGAVDHAAFGNPSGTVGVIEPYSSRGPTNGGLLAPDVCGPTNTDTFSYPGGFSGTSCATPNVAGMVAALWSADTSVTPVVIRDAVYQWALALRDWGPPGHENTYGRGGAILPRVRIDIMPGQHPNPIVLGRNYTIYVGLLADGDTFPDVGTVSSLSIRFGPTLSYALTRPVAPAVPMDLNGDALTDLLLGFLSNDTWFMTWDVRGVLRGRFSNGAPFACADSVVVTHAPVLVVGGHGANDAASVGSRGGANP